MFGIIVAIPEELKSIKEIMNDVTAEKKYNTDFYIGKIKNKECVVSICGVGKVNAAKTTQFMIDNYCPDKIINCGVAGGLGNRVKIGDIVIGEKLVQHDFDLTAFGREKGEVSNEVGKFIYSDKSLVEKALKISNNIVFVLGTIAPGDIFITDSKMSSKINTKFNADCCEMEGAAVAQTCFLDNVPFLVIRSISDSPSDNNKVDYDTFVGEASQKVASFIENLFNEL